MAVTIHHVAKRAGVSAGTASRALRGHPQLSRACIERVRAADDELGYLPLRDRSGRSRPEPLVDAATEALRRRSGRGATPAPTAIFCPADSIAALVYRALASCGLVPGRDVSVVSCNHERSLVAGLWPSLATIDVHPQRLGRMAVEQLTRRVTGEFAGAAVQIGITPTFIPGGSLTACRKPGAAARRAR